MSPSHKATATWSQYIQAQTDTQRLGDRKKNEEREAEMEKRERKIKSGREMESKAEGDKDRMRQKMRSKQQEWEKQVTEESLLVSPGCGPPPLLFFGFHSNREGSTKFTYTFTSFLSA